MLHTGFETTDYYLEKQKRFQETLQPEDIKEIII